MRKLIGFMSERKQDKAKDDHLNQLSEIMRKRAKIRYQAALVLCHDLEYMVAEGIIDLSQWKGAQGLFCRMKTQHVGGSPFLIGELYDAHRKGIINLNNWPAARAWWKACEPPTYS